MARRILVLILIVILAVSCYYAWKNYQRRERMDDGNVSCTGCLSPEQERAFKRENAGEGIDGQSEHKFDWRGTEQDRHNGEDRYPDPNARRPEPTYDGSVHPVPDNDPNQRFRFPAPENGYDRDHGRDGQRRFDDPSRRFEEPQYGRDTLQPVPPNGAAFAGRGQYQWYREGNLTWRLNTETGASCVAYATLEEWRKPLVYSHGCGRG